MFNTSYFYSVTLYDETKLEHNSGSALMDHCCSVTVLARITNMTLSFAGKATPIILTESWCLTMENFVGSHMIYTYENGWEYEIYIKNDHTIDYRIHSGMVAGRWVRDQQVDLVKLTEGVYKVSWTEPTGTDVSLNFMPTEKRMHGIIFFPKWVHERPDITVCFQNDHIALMEESRLKYETYPKYVVPEFADITFIEHAGVDNEDVIAVAPYPGMTDDIRAGRPLRRD